MKRLQALMFSGALILATASPLFAVTQLDGQVGEVQAKPGDLAYNNGYQAGFKLGQSDKKSGTKQDFSQASAYRRATDGWKEGVSGDLEPYRTNYRAGFADGYKDGLGEAPTPAPPDRPERDASREVPPMRETPREARENESRRENPPAESAEVPARQAPGASAPPPPPSPDGSLSVSDGTVIRIRLENTISTRTSRQGDVFTAIVSEPVYLPGSTVVAVPVGAKISGSVTRVLRPGRVKGTAELHLRYDRLTMPGGTDFTMSATTAGVGDVHAGKVDQGEGTINGNTSKKRDGEVVGTSAAGGAVIGAVVGGPAGAAVGALVGAAVGTGGVLVTRGKDVDLQSGTELQIRLIQPLNVVNPVR